MLAGDGMDTKTKDEKSFKEALEAGKTTDNEMTTKSNKGIKEKSNGNGSEILEKKRKEMGTKIKLIKKDLEGKKNNSGDNDKGFDKKVGKFKKKLVENEDGFRVMRKGNNGNKSDSESDKSEKSWNGTGERIKKVEKVGKMGRF